VNKTIEEAHGDAEREREREREKVCVCVCERERERESEEERANYHLSENDETWFLASKHNPIDTCRQKVVTVKKVFFFNFAVTIIEENQPLTER